MKRERARRRERDVQMPVGKMSERERG